jgi:hypothetical protein
MTTPTGFSPNIRILPKEASLPADAPKSQTPLAEAALAELLQGGRLGIRDMYKPVPALPEIVTDEARAGWDALAEDVATGYESGRLLLEDWWRHGRAETFSRPAFWSAPVTPPAPEAHPYPAPAPVAEVVHWTPEEPDQPACDADVDAPADTDMLGSLNLSKVTCRACQQVAIDEAPAPVAAEPVPEPAADGPVDVMETWTPPQYAQDAAEKTYGLVAPVAEPERDPAEDAPAGRAVGDGEPATAVLLEMAKPEEAAKEPDATQVIAVTDAPTEAVPVVKTDGGESDDA